MSPVQLCKLFNTCVWSDVLFSTELWTFPSNVFFTCSASMVSHDRFNRIFQLRLLLVAKRSSLHASTTATFVHWSCSHGMVSYDFSFMSCRHTSSILWLVLITMTFCPYLSALYDFSFRALYIVHSLIREMFSFLFYHCAALSKNDFSFQIQGSFLFHVWALAHEESFRFTAQLHKSFCLFLHKFVN